MATEVRRRALLVSAALVVGILIGILVGLSFDSESEVDAPQAKPESEGPGPTRELNGVPVGYARTQEGAVAAAANFSLLSGRDDLLNLQAMTQAMQTLAAPSWKQQAAGEAKAGFDYVVGTYGQDAEVTAAVLRHDVQSFTEDEAVVDLWVVTVLAGSQRRNVDQAWGIVTVSLKWVEGDWRVAGIQSSPSPAPVDLPSATSDQTARDVLEEFDEFGGLLRP